MMFRIEPNLPASAYKTYQILAPLSTHYRPATCEEYECPAMANGWISRIDESTDLGQKQAHYIRQQSGRKFTEEREPTGLTAFTFASGQPCFSDHQIRVEREELYFVKGGDFRGNPLGIAPRQHTRAEFWVEDFAEHQAKVADQIEKG